MQDKIEKQEQIAIASVPKQEWKETYNKEEALKQGTIFPELNKPFYLADE